MSQQIVNYYLRLKNKCKISHRQAKAKIKLRVVWFDWTIYRTNFVTSKSGENSAEKTCLLLYTAWHVLALISVFSQHYYFFTFHVRACEPIFFRLRAGKNCMAFFFYQIPYNIAYTVYTYRADIYYVVFVLALSSLYTFIHMCAFIYTMNRNKNILCQFVCGGKNPYCTLLLFLLLPSLQCTTHTNIRSAPFCVQTILWKIFRIRVSTTCVY